MVFSLVPLFAPTLAAGAVLSCRAKGWITLTARETWIVACMGAAIFAFFVPLTFAVAQLIIAALILATTWHRARFPGRPLVAGVVAFALLGLVMLGATPTTSSLPAVFPRAVVGRILDSFPRVNISDASGSRTVVVIGVQDAYATVASTGYPARVEHLPTETIAHGIPCEPRTGGVKQSLFALITSAFGHTPSGGTPACVT
jgi:hypothetical protein